MKHLIAQLSLGLLFGCGEEVSNLAKPPEAVPASRHLSHEVEGDTITITGCHKKASGSLIIPRTIEGKSVAKIQRLAFSDCIRLTKVTIPDRVTSIGEGAFLGCTSLTSITIPDSVTSIGRSAFHYCSRLTSIEIPSGVTSIGGSAFSSCRNLNEILVNEENKEFVSINGVLFSKDYSKLIAFPAGKTDITYTIPDSVTSIAGRAINSCQNLNEITIPDGVTIIGESAFHSCMFLNLSLIHI